MFQSRSHRVWLVFLIGWAFCFPLYVWAYSYDSTGYNIRDLILQAILIGETPLFAFIGWRWIRAARNVK